MSPDKKTDMVVMFTDIVGFTGYMERDETGALAMISEVREVLIPLLEVYRGRLIKEMGDGTLSVFTDPRSAMKCATELQEALSGEVFRLRIGMHMGTVLVMPDDILGDTVNVASRLEKMAPSGGVCISDELLGNLGTGRRPAVHSLGLRKLKGLGRLVRVHLLKGTSRNPLPTAPVPGFAGDTLNMLGERVPSVAVMPLENLGSGDDDFYAMGVSEEIVNQLSAGGVAVAPLRDVVNLKRVVNSETDTARRLKTRFFVRGTLLREDESFHVSVELHDLERNRLIWTDEWTDHWFELPGIKTKIADSLLKVFGIGGITSSEGTPDAYRLLLRASELYWKRKSFDDVIRARELLEEALVAEPDHVQARILLGISYSENGDFARGGEELGRAYENAQMKADRMGHLNALIWIGINQWHRSDFRSAMNTFKRSIMLARNLGNLQAEARSLSNLGLMEINLGEYEAALDHFQKAMEVSGVPSMGNLEANTLCNIGLTHWHMGDNETAYEFYRKSLELFENLESIDGQATVMMNMGIVTRNMGMLQRSIELTEKAMDLHLRIGDRQGQCRTLVGLGNIRRQAGITGEALENYRKAHVLAEEIGDRMTSGITLTNMADIYCDIDEYEKAEGLYRKALDISLELGDRQGEGENLGFLGCVHRIMGKMEMAVDYLNRSIAVFEEMDAPAGAIASRLNLAEVLLDSGPFFDPAGAAEQVRLVEEMVHSGMNEYVAVSFSLSELLRRLSAISSPGNCNRMLRSSMEYLEKAREALLATAATIEDDALRESFMAKKSSRNIIGRSQETG